MPKMPHDVWEVLKVSVARMESSLAAMKELRKYQSKEALTVLDAAIERHEKQLAELQRMVVN